MPMGRTTKQVGAVLALLAMFVFAAWPLGKWLHVKNVDALTRARVESLVAGKPEFLPALQAALENGDLSEDEARVLFALFGETLEGSK
jgi:hypothetical protein